MVHTDSMNVKARKADQSEATRKALVAAGRELFAKRGYRHTSTQEVVKLAGVTRGALYHHFRDKADLFAAVFEDLSEEIIRRVGKAANLAGPVGTWEHFVGGCQAFLDACLDPAIRQIVLLDAPSALGWERWRELDCKYGFAIVKKALQASMEAGLIDRQPVDPLAHMLVGGLNEAALAMARADNPEEARAETGTGIDRVLNGLRTRDPKTDER
jgi:AcrR family transcriptional regulator